MRLAAPVRICAGGAEKSACLPRPRRHRPLILNWFKAKGAISNGIVEGLNNKAKLTIRKSYGFRSPEILEMALYHALGKLPEPKLTHEFY